MAEDLLDELARAARDETTEWWMDPRWEALCAGMLSPQEHQVLINEAEKHSLGTLALELFQPLESSFRESMVRQLQGELLLSLIERCLKGEPDALDDLVKRLTPIIQARVARILLRRSRESEPRNLRQEVEDLTQEMFVILFTDDAKVLRSWQPGRGLSLENFAGLVTERQVTSFLRSGKRNPWREDPTLTEDLDEASPELDPETQTASREQLVQLLDRLREELSPEGWHLFDLLFLREWTIEQIVQETGKSPEAIYAWRSRLRRLARKLLNEND